MKKLLYFIFILFFAFNFKAQMWCPPGATWHYRVYANMYPYYDGHLKLTVTNTVLINSIVCNNMVGTYIGKIMSPSASTSTLNNYVNINTYESNKVVYIYNTDSLNFDTIANFNANIGDKWLGIKYPAGTCIANYVRPILTVVDTGHVMINNIFLKKIKVSSQASPTYSFTMIEKISGLSGFLFPYSHCIIDGPIFGNFVCYSDNNFPLYNPSSSICDYIPTGVGINENSLSNSLLKLYPNPTNGNFNVELDKPCKLKIYNALGSLVYENEFIAAGNFQIDISDLLNGIYTIKAENEQGSSYSKLIKE